MSRAFGTSANDHHHGCGRGSHCRGRYSCQCRRAFGPTVGLQAIVVGHWGQGEDSHHDPQQNKSDGASATKQAGSTTKPTGTTKTSGTKTRLHSGYYYRTGPNRSARVVLSYDDCPRSLAEFKTVIVGAQKLGIGLMLFPTGVCLQSGQFSTSFARAHGHYVFNHSISHPDLARLSSAGVLHQLGAPGFNPATDARRTARTAPPWRRPTRPRA